MAKSKLIAAAALTAVMLLPSCSSGDKENTISFIPAKADKGDNWGFIGPDGKFIVKEEFKNEPSIAVNGVFTVEEDNGISVYTLDGEKPKVIGDLENLKSAGAMSYGLIPVTRKGERITYCDKDGKTVFTLDPVKGHEIVSTQAYFHEGLTIVSFDDESVGVIDTKGKIVVESGKYSYMSPYFDGISIATPISKKESSEENVKVVFVDKGGKEVASVKGYEFNGVFHDGYVAAEKDDRVGLLDKKGEFHKLSAKVKNVQQWTDKIVIYRDEDGNRGAMTIEGEQIIRAKYEDLLLLNNGKFLGKTDNDKYYIINNKDEREKEIEDVDNILPLGTYVKWNGFYTEFVFIVTEGDSHYLLNEKGEKIDKTEYYEIGFNENNFVYTDYFNAAGAAENLVSHVTARGYNQVEVGTPLYKYFEGSPSSYPSTDKYNFEDVSGFQYRISGYAYTNGYVASSTPVYTTEYYYGYSYQSLDHYDYSWNKDALCDKISVTLNVEKSGYYSVIKDAMTSGMKSKGYKVEENTEAYSVYKQGNVVAVVLPESNYNSSSLQMYMFTANTWNEWKSSIVEDAKSRFADIKSKQGIFVLSAEEEAIARRIAAEKQLQAELDAMAGIDEVEYADTIAPEGMMCKQ